MIVKTLLIISVIKMDAKMIKISKLNESYLKISGIEFSEAKFLNENFSFFAENYRFHPKFKKKQWDGRIRLFNLRDSTLPFGCLNKVINLFNSVGFEYELDESLKNIGMSVLPKDITDFVNKELLCDMVLRDYQLTGVITALQKGKCITVLPTACHGKGEMIIMGDSSIKKIEEINVDDYVMGQDGTPKKVLKTFKGQDKIYTLKTKGNKDNVTVTGNHILMLKVITDDGRLKKGDIIEITLDDYLKKSKWFKHITKLYYNSKEIEFKRIEHECKLDPYFIGVYLGDGSVDSCQITNSDKEVIEEIYKQAKKIGCDVNENPSNHFSITGIMTGGSKTRNKIFYEFDKIGLCFSKKNSKVKCADKFIPEVLFSESIEYRYDLLAGLLDTDGYLSDSKTYFEYSSKSEKLVEGVKRLAVSLGLYVSSKMKRVNGVDYYVCNILGDIHKIPTKVKRKSQQKTEKSQYNYITGFDVEGGDVSDYYGIQVEDSLYLHKSGMVLHNSGKSFCQFTIVNYLLKKQYCEKVLLIVPTLSLVDQMQYDFLDYGKNIENYKNNIHTIYSGKDKNSDCPIIITTWQSMLNVEPEYFEQFDCVLVDECHLATGKSITSILNSCINSKFRFGVSGTLQDSKVSKVQLESIIGEIVESVDTRQLIDDGTLTPIKIYNLVIKYKDEVKKNLLNQIKQEKENNKKFNAATKYKIEMDLISSSKERKKILLKTVKKCNSNTLVLFKHVNYGKELTKIFTKYTDRNVYFIYGDISPDERERIRLIMEQETNAIIVASLNIFSTGINIKKLKYLIFAQPIRSKIKVLQSIGRILRKHDSKEEAILIDIIDNISGKNFSYKHAIDKLDLYDKEGFTYKVKYITI